MTIMKKVAKKSKKKTAKASGRGGKRTGAGRKAGPSGPKVYCNMMLPPDIVAEIDRLAADSGNARPKVAEMLIRKGLKENQKKS